MQSSGDAPHRQGRNYLSAPPDDAFVTLIGKATLHENASEVSERWTDAYDAFFPSAADRANAIFVVVHIERIKLWIRGDELRVR
jgi:general stress protein 26